jgi:cytochrome c2
MGSCKKAIKIMRKEVIQARKDAKKAGKNNDYSNAIIHMAYAGGVEWTLDTLEYYLEHGRLP